MLGNFSCFLLSAYFFKINLWKNSFRNTISMSNSLDPDLGPYCLPGYHQMTLVDKELKHMFTFKRPILFSANREYLQGFLPRSEISGRDSECSP